MKIQLSIVQVYDVFLHNRHSHAAMQTVKKYLANHDLNFQLLKLFDYVDCQEVKRDDGQTACYKIASEGSSYHEALEACISEGYTLAEVQGPQDQANLMAMAQPFKVNIKGPNCKLMISTEK